MERSRWEGQNFQPLKEVQRLEEEEEEEEEEEKGVCILYTHWVSCVSSSLVDICVGITSDTAEHSYRQ